MLLDIGESGHDLVLGGQLGTLLELEIANGTRQGEVTVNSAKVDEATSCCNAVLLV